MAGKANHRATDMRNRQESSRQEFVLTNIEVGGFKSAINPVRIKLKDLTVLAGQNSSGKSTIIQPLLLLKQTMEKPFDPGALAIDGPLVQFTSADQFFSHFQNGQVSEFFLKMTSKESYLNLIYKKANERGVILDRMELLRNRKQYTWREGQEIPLSDMDFPEEILETFRRMGDRLVVTRNRAMLIASLMQQNRKRKVSLDLTTSPAYPFIDAVTKMIHLPGLRGNPERNYHISAIGSEYPGNFSEYIASIIHRWQAMRDERLGHLAKNLRNLGLTWKVTTRPIDDTRVEILVGRLPSAIRGGARDIISIADVGFGVSQTLPVLVALLAASPGQLVFIEQPEIHLHPKAQVGLGELLLGAMHRGIRVIVETHSSLLVLSLQKLIAEGKLDPARVSMNWFTRDETSGATRVIEAVVGPDGSYGEWPSDFGSVELELQASYLDSVDRRAAHLSSSGR